MATVTGDLTVQCVDTNEFNTTLANIQANANYSNIASNSGTLVITCHVSGN